MKSNKEKISVRYFIVAMLMFVIAVSAYCGICGEQVAKVSFAEDIHVHVYTNAEDNVCNECGYVRYYEGDYNGNGILDENDAEYMLFNIFFGDDLYPLDEKQPLRDYTEDGMINSDDAIWLHDYIAKITAHTLVFHREKASTCIENGNIEYWSCTHCSKYFTDPLCEQEILYADTIKQSGGHSYELIEKKDCTCTENGYEKYRCSVCEKEKTQVWYATGHSFGYDNVCDECGYEITIHEHDYTAVVTRPGCVTMGYTTYTCSCGHTYVDNYIEPSGHKWDGGTVITEKTCTENGLLEYCCTECTAKRQDIIYAGHEWGETVTVEKTCTTDGEISRTCSKCSLEEKVVIPAGHEWDEGHVTKAATCEEDGEKTVTCIKCSATDTVVISKKGHRFVAGVCEDCGEKFIDNVTPSDHPIYGMYFLVSDIVSKYGPELINEYGVLLYVNEGAQLDKVAVYLTQDSTMWRRCIACTGTNIEFAVYVPYLSYGTDILYTGLNSDWINTFSLKQGSDGIWRYNEYTTIGVNLEDSQGNLLLSLYDIGQAGAKTKVFDDLAKMKEWLLGEDPDAPHTHTVVIDAEIPATCTSNGLTAGSHCSVCGEVIVARTIIPMSHNIIEHVGEEKATCNESGHSAYDICSRCGKVGYVYYPALKHNMKTTVVQVLSCTVDGVIRHYCANDGCSYSYDVITKGEHNYQENGRKEATCTEDGYIEYKCTKCSDTYQNIIPGSHNYVGAVTKKATKSEVGVMTYTCDKCGDCYTVDIEKLREGEYVLLVQDTSPWRTDTNAVLLNGLVADGYIAGWNLVTSSELKGTYDLAEYGVIYIANDQATSTYNNLADCSAKLSQFVQDGGSLVYGACDKGWQNGSISQLIGTVTKNNYYSYYNYVVDKSHPIVTGELTDYEELTDAMLYHNYTSHTYFTNLPADATIILQDGNGNPTLVEYSLGEKGGTVILSGLTWEHNYVYRYQTLSYSKSVYDDLIVYAMSRQDVCSHEYGEGVVVAPTCTEKGYTRHVCALCEREYRDNYVDMVPHTATHYDRIEANHTKEGNIEYWFCTECEKYFSDSACKNEISETDIVISKGHTLEHVPYLAKTCTTDGNIEYWYCTECKKYYSDSACTIEITQAQTIIAMGHTITHFEAKAKTCTADGNIEYWYCADCKKYYLDIAFTDETTLSNVIIPKSHELEHIEEESATCLKNGNIEYWYCTVCKKYYQDSACTIDITASQTVLTATGHDYVDGKCTRCDDRIKIVSVESITLGNVAYNTAYSSLALPTKVTCTSESGASIRFDVVWSSSSYSKTTYGAQIISGTLTTLQYNFAVSSSVNATVFVSETITEIEQYNIGVLPIGTPFKELGLPSQIKITTEKGSKYVSATWTESDYNPNVTYLQTIHGTLTIPEGYLFATGITTSISTTLTLSETLYSTADIVFIVDTTGSMSGYISTTKSSIQAFTQALNDDGLSVRYSLVEYRDITCDGNSSTKIHYDGVNPWYTDVDKFKTKISNLTVDGGGDTPETVIDALAMAYYDLDYRPGASVFYIVVTDANYKTNNNYSVSSMSAMIDLLKSKNIITSVVTSSSYQSYYTDITSETNGKLLNVGSNFSTELLTLREVMNVHEYTSDVYTRVDGSGNVSASGDYILFGTYPQTEVTDSATKSALNNLRGTLPTSSNKQGWTSYKYYISDSNTTDYMWYIDVTYNSEKYRGVYFTSYRPYYTTSSSSTGNSYQDDNGYSTSTVYWFKYEPIKWRILEESGGYATILCEMIIDSQEYYPSDSTSSFSHNGGTGYANNYALSNIRKWLNETFYNTAFNDLQKALIQTVTVDNSARSTNPDNNATLWNSGNNTYACENTQDKVWLLSEQEVTKSAYGFSTDYSAYDTVRRKQTTDYAQAQGAYTSTNTVYKGNGDWWLRSPNYCYSYTAWGVDLVGITDYYIFVNYSIIGVVPALKIRLS